jgi:hypothetical protein
MMLWLGGTWMAFAQDQAGSREDTVVMPDIQAIAVDVARLELPVVAFIFILLSLISLLLFGVYKPRRSFTASAFVICTVAAGLSWSLQLQPTITLASPFVSKPDADESRLLLQALLRNTYNAFTFRDESDVYDMLALSVTGEQLVDIYLQNRESLRIEEAEGRTMTIDDVRVVGSLKKVERQGGSLVMHAEWYVIGSVTHWDHAHTRLNTYEAVVTVREENDSYKISDIDIIKEKRTL